MIISHYHLVFIGNPAIISNQLHNWNVYISTNSYLPKSWILFLTTIAV